jgi:hypothetical protein
MNATLSLLALVLAPAAPADVPRVRALAVTHLGFAEKDRTKLADTSLKLLASCSSACPSSEKDFQSLFRQCHLHVKFATAREVKARGGEKVKVDELIVSFPTNTGGIWVRSGEDYRYFTKFEYEHCLAIHELLKSGKPE